MFLVHLLKLRSQKSMTITPFMKNLEGNDKVDFLYWIALSVLNCSSYRSSKDHLLLIQS